VLKMKAKTTDKAKVWRRIEKQFGEMNDLHVVVGVPAGADARKPKEGEKGEPATMAEVAFYNEFGTEHIPERSFLRSTVDANAGKYAKLYEKLMGAVFEGKLTVRQAMGLLGEKARADVRKTIRSDVPPPNAPATLRRKKSTKTLVDTGQLSQSITYEVRDGKPGKEET